MKGHHVRAILLVIALLMSGCATGPGRVKELQRIGNSAKLNPHAKVGMTNFSKCGGAYLDKLNPDYYDFDVKAILYNRCTELGYPAQFQDRLRLDLERKLGRKLTSVSVNKPFKAKTVYKEAERLGLDYVISGAQLYLAENDHGAVVSVLFYVISVPEKKIVLLGRVNKSGEKGKIPYLIDAVADELYNKAYND